MPGGTGQDLGQREYGKTFSANLCVDRAVFAAYGWADNLTDEEILEKAAGAKFGAGSGAGKHGKTKWCQLNFRIIT